jgi:hypothetical protein
MIWLTWRQFRAQALWIYGAVGVVALILLITGAQLADLADTAGSSLFDALNGDRWKNAEFNLGFMAVITFPAIVGVFWGAPLIARELEAGTHRLAWNQTVTRSGWLATKLALAGLAAMLGAGLLSLLFTWWCGPLDDVIATSGRQNGLLGIPRIAPPMFGARGIVPIGYTAFTFSLGVTSGAVLRRTVPAMAVTLVVFVAVQILMPPLVRSHLGPSQVTSTITAQNLTGLMAEGPDGPVRELRIRTPERTAWDISNRTIDAKGNPVSTLQAWVLGCVPGDVPRGPRSDPQCFTRLEQLGYRQQVTYQPASRFWTLQAIETAIFLALAAALTGFCFWWVRRLS